MRRIHIVSLAVLSLALAASAQGKRPETPAAQLKGTFNYISNNVLEMAKDFPEDKYNFKAKPEMRTFGEVIAHVFTGHMYAAQAAAGGKTTWGQMEKLHPESSYHSKAEIVAMAEKALADCNAALKAMPDSKFNETLEPWLSVTEHTAEHYGLLVAYYRLNGIVPPASRPKSK